MVAKWRLFHIKQKLWFSVPIIAAGALIYFGNTVLAQVTSDQTLGKENSVVTPVNSNVDRIDGGAVRGSNLFHSFKDFNVGQGRRVDFANPAGIENIFSRVTGGNRSDILGTLGVLGNANLFLLNPNGIIFGPNAQLDIRGSFVASTASSFSFGDSLEYSATNPQAPPLLKVNFTPGLQLGAKLPGEIVNEGNLTVGKDLSLWGGSVTSKGILGTPEGQLTVESVVGDVHIKDVVAAKTAKISARGNLILEESQLLTTDDLNLFAQDTVRIRDSATNPFVVEAGGNLLVQGNQGIDIFGLNYPQSYLFSSGDITLLGKDNINISNSIIISEGLLAGNINIKSDGEVGINNSRIFAHNSNTAPGEKGGDINLSAKSLLVQDNSIIATQTTGKGNPGNVIITGDTVAFDSDSYVVTRVSSEVEGIAGDIIINTGSLSLINGASLNTNSHGNGNSGNLKITARENIFIDGVGNNIRSSGIFSEYNSLSPGKAGDITITTSSLFVTNGAVISSSFDGNGEAGNVTINARNTVHFDGVGKNNSPSQIISDLTPEAQGKTGNINITTGSLFFTNGATLDNSNSGIGNTGKIKIKADHTVLFDGDSKVFNLVSQGTEGMKGGGIEIITDSLSVKNGASLLTSTFGNVDGGDVIITARNGIYFDSGGIYSNPFSEDIENSLEVTGDGGDIKITANLLQVSDSTFSTSSASSGNSGKIKINATDFVLVNDGSFLSSNTNGQGNAGNIEINAGNLVHFDGSGFLEEFDLSIFGLDTKVSAGETFTGVSSGVFQSKELGQVGSGKGGDIKITTGSLFVTNGASLGTFTVGAGDNADAGDIIIRAQDVVSFDGKGPSAITSTLGVVPLLNGEFIRTEITGDGGDIDIQARSLSITNGASLVTGTSGKGKAGNIRINTTESVIISGTEPLFENIDGNTQPQVSRLGTGAGDSSLALNETGAAGNIDIETGLLKLSNAGTLSTRSESTAKAGNININANILELTDGGSIITRTNSTGTGTAGDITVNATEKIIISGIDSRLPIPESGFFANSLSAEETDAGNIKVNTPFLVMDNQGKISTETNSGNGGNITLKVQDILLMRNQSNISTTAGTNEQLGDGGNINISNGFLVTVPNENSDITANAFEGKGGKINIASEKIFWMEQRDRKKLIELLGSSSELNPNLLSTNDITAFSQQNPNLDGFITINLLNTVDPSRGLTSLPTAFVDPSELIDQSCTLSSSKSSSQFVNTGSGGLPTNPSNPLSPNNTVKRMATPITRRSHIAQISQTAQRMQTSSSSSTIPLPEHQEPESIVEAQGWVRLSNGKIRLVAQAPSVTPQGNWQTMSSCYVH